MRGSEVLLERCGYRILRVAPLRVAIEVRPEVPHLLAGDDPTGCVPGDPRGHRLLPRLPGYGPMVGNEERGLGAVLGSLDCLRLERAVVQDVALLLQHDLVRDLIDHGVPGSGLLQLLDELVPGAHAEDLRHGVGMEPTRPLQPKGPNVRGEPAPDIPPPLRLDELTRELLRLEALRGVPYKELPRLQPVTCLDAGPEVDLPLCQSSDLSPLRLESFRPPAPGLRQNLGVEHAVALCDGPRLRFG